MASRQKRNSNRGNTTGPKPVAKPAERGTLFIIDPQEKARPFHFKEFWALTNDWVMA